MVHSDLSYSRVQLFFCNLKKSSSPFVPSLATVTLVQSTALITFAEEISRSRWQALPSFEPCIRHKFQSYQILHHVPLRATRLLKVRQVRRIYQFTLNNEDCFESSCCCRRLSHCHRRCPASSIHRSSTFDLQSNRHKEPFSSDDLNCKSFIGLSFGMTIQNAETSDQLGFSK